MKKWLLALGAVALLAGLLMTRAFKPFKLPSVTAYLIAGVLIGPYCIGALHIEGLGFTSMEEVEVLHLVAEVALGFIAFSIGSEFRLEDLKKIGKQAFVIGIFQALTATVLVCDVIPNRKTTRFLDAAREAGCQTFNGLDMLVNQGIRCFEIWTGQKAPVEVMAKALKREYGIED